MAYDSNTQIISAPVSIYDVQRALGLASADLGTLCVSDGINMWALYKPQRHSSVGQITFENRRGVSGSSWEFLLGEHFGITIPYHSYMQDQVSHGDADNSYIRFDRTCEMILNGDLAGFVYSKPRGYRSPSSPIEPYRLTDFVRKVPDTDPSESSLLGYHHNTIPPFTAELDISNATGWWSGEQCYYYQVHGEHRATEVRFIFHNQPGADLKMQYFLDLNMGTWVSENIRWRPYMQLYQNDNWESDYNYTLLDAAGPPITSTDENGNPVNSFTLSIPIEWFGDINGTFYVYLGIACCDNANVPPKERSILRNGTGIYALFPIPPYLGNVAPFKVKIGIWQ